LRQVSPQIISRERRNLKNQRTIVSLDLYRNDAGPFPVVSPCRFTTPVMIPASFMVATFAQMDELICVRCSIQPFSNFL
jgi:hypothetical protein